MILCAQGGSDWHLVRYAAKSGMGLKVEAYCGQECESRIDQLPDAFLSKLCKGCQENAESVKQQA